MTSAVIGAILRNEWLRRRRSWVAVGLAFGCVLILGAAIWAASGRAVERTLEIETAIAAQDADRDRLLKRLDKAVAAGKGVGYYDSRSPAYAGGKRGRRYATMPPEFGAWLAVGQSDLFPAALAVSTEEAPTLAKPTERENPEVLAEGGLDPAFVIVVLLPLLVLGLSFDLLSGERETGTLALVLSHPVSAGAYAATRAMALWVGVMALVALSAALTLSLCVRPSMAPNPAVLTAAAGLIGGYLIFWLAAAIAVQSRGWSSATNAAALAALWLLVVVLTPAALNSGVRACYPAPSRLELVQARRDAARHAQEEGAGALAEFYQDHPELASGDSGDAKVDEYTLQKLLLTDHVSEAIKPLEDRFRSQAAVQQLLVDRLRFLSPAVVMHQALTELAGTSTLHFQAFETRARAFRTAWDEWFRPRIFGKQSISRADYERMPTWEATPHVPIGIQARILSAFLGLLIPAALLLMVSARGLRTYPARR